MIILFLMTMSTLAHGDWCSQSYRFESYGLGVLASFEPQFSLPSIYDRGCYGIGRDAGASALVEYSSDEQECRTSFRDGLAQGFLAEMLVIRGISRCAQLGHNSGNALLSAWARQGRSDKVGPACVDAYRLGYQDGKADSGARGAPDNRWAYCYSTGYNDSDFF